MNILTYIINLTLHKNKICLYMIYGRKSSLGEHIWENFRGNSLALEGWVQNANRGKSPQGRNLIILWKGKCGYPWGRSIPYICTTMYLLYTCEKRAYRGIFRENKNCNCTLFQWQKGYPHFLFDSSDFHYISKYATRITRNSWKCGLHLKKYLNNTRDAIVWWSYWDVPGS